MACNFASLPALVTDDVLYFHTHTCTQPVQHESLVYELVERFTVQGSTQTQAKVSMWPSPPDNSQVLLFFMAQRIACHLGEGRLHIHILLGRRLKVGHAAFGLCPGFSLFLGHLQQRA